MNDNLTHATKVDYREQDRREAERFADAFIETVNADHDDVISFGRDAGCRIRDHIENLRRELKGLAATPVAPEVNHVAICNVCKEGRLFIGTVAMCPNHDRQNSDIYPLAKAVPSAEPVAPAIEAFGVEPYPAIEAITHACGLLDVIKSEWGEKVWSEHDQKTRAGLSEILRSAYLSKLAEPVAPTSVKEPIPHYFPNPHKTRTVAEPVAEDRTGKPTYVWTPEEARAQGLVVPEGVDSVQIYAAQSAGLEAVVRAAMRDNVNLGLYNGFTIQQWMDRVLAAEANRTAAPCYPFDQVNLRNAARIVVEWFDGCRPDLIGPRINALREEIRKSDYMHPENPVAPGQSAAPELKGQPKTVDDGPLSPSFVEYAVNQNRASLGLPPQHLEPVPSPAQPAKEANDALK